MNKVIEFEIYNDENDKFLFTKVTEIDSDAEFVEYSVQYIIEFMVNNFKYSVKFDTMGAALNCYHNMDHNFLKFI